jgi:diguanylate cyclase (GGDEF)-like protein/PAS domain S-box-containing protein
MRPHPTRPGDDSPEDAPGLPVDALLARGSTLVVALDRQGRPCWATANAHTVLGNRAVAAGERSGFDLLHPDDVDSARAAFADAARSPGTHPPIRSRILDDTGEWRWIEADVDNALDDPEIGALVLSLRRVDARPRREAMANSVRAVLDAAPIVVITFDDERRITFFGGNLGPAGTGRTVVLGQPVDVLTDDPALLSLVGRILAGESVTAVATLPASDVVVEVRGAPMVDGGVVVGGVVAVSDASAGHDAHAALRASEARFRSLVQRSSDIAMIMGPDTRITYASPSVRVLGHDPVQITATALVDYCDPHDADDLLTTFADLAAEPGATRICELRVRDASGHYHWLEAVLANHLDDAAVAGVVGNLRDITDRKRAEQTATDLAHTDALTALPNRTLLIERLREMMSRAEVAGERVTVVFVGLDRFKLINESLGHASGDDVLREMAFRLRAVVRDEDVVARFGGDEFVVLVEGGDETLPQQVAERIATSIARPVELAEGRFFATASIGVASTPPHRADDVLRNAGSAMHQAKDHGRSRIEFWDSGLSDDARTSLQIRNELRQAIDAEQFVLHYQPIMNMNGGAIDGMEALVRWNHPERGMVPPLAFIPAAEDTGLIVELGAWVVRQACLEACRWPGRRHVAVNLSVRQLADHAIVDVVAEALAVSGLDPHRLVLEVTESALMDNAEMALGCLNDLKALGVRLAIDDFGTGYSSLVYLKRMPVDAIKVDRSFVDGLGEDAEDTAIVSSVVSLAHAVGVQAIAEGVETAAQRAHLERLGCDFGQGYLWSRPVPADEVAAMWPEEPALTVP